MAHAGRIELADGFAGTQQAKPQSLLVTPGGFEDDMNVRWQRGDEFTVTGGRVGQPGVLLARQAVDVEPLG